MGRARATRNAKMLRPAALRPGDRVGIIAPASNIDFAALEKGAEKLERLGYEPVFSESIVDRDIYFAGSVERRVRELEAMFESRDIKAIVCARGGYGTNHLLPQVDIRKIRGNPKIFVGYSDITSLLTWFADNGLVVFHGPMVAKDFAHEGGVDEDAWEAVLGGEVTALEFGPESDIKPLVAGAAKGVLYGGCLSLLVASLGTPYEIQTEGKLLFIEDIGAKPYQVDRMLMQLKLAGKLKKVRGMVFGEMMDCVQPGGQDYSLPDVIKRTVGDLGVPIAFGFPSGHVLVGNFVLPFGVSATLEVSRKHVRFSMDAATYAG
jgi:muramoyltetrapeptide carboxypeptidase